MKYEDSKVARVRTIIDNARKDKQTIPIGRFTFEEYEIAMHLLDEMDVKAYVKEDNLILKVK